MKVLRIYRILPTLIFCMFILPASAQPMSYKDQGIAKARMGKLREALELFIISSERTPDDYEIWYYRGVTESMLKEYEAALADFDKTIRMNPAFKKAYFNRGNMKRRLTNYTGAITDYSIAIRLDAKYDEAYYSRGIIYEMLGKKTEACADYVTAKGFGMTEAEYKVQECNDTGYKETHPILRLVKKADNDKYGFTPENPVKVGSGPDGGPGNQRAYLDLLRDAAGKPIDYVRLGSCCAYSSANGILGRALLDQYEIRYLNKKGKEKKALVYISFYDFEEPMILYGFKTVGEK